LKSAYYMSKYVIPEMLKANKGSIINNASIQGIHSQKTVSVYAASKVNTSNICIVVCIIVNFFEYHILGFR
jgi:NADP-dependent 3-hydroxy acid dehydrogenase YdfG